MGKFKYWIELMLIVGYLFSDNLHMFFPEVAHGALNPNYTWRYTVYSPMMYLCSIPLLPMAIIFYYSPMDSIKISIRLSLLIVSFITFIGELLEALNISINFFSNYGYGTGMLFRILFVICMVTVSIYLKKHCKKLHKYALYS